MEHLFKYHGTVSSIGFSSKGCSAADLILGDITDWDMPRYVWRRMEHWQNTSMRLK